MQSHNTTNSIYYINTLYRDIYNGGMETRDLHIDLFNKFGRVISACPYESLIFGT